MYLFFSHERHQVTRRRFCPGGDRFVFSVLFVGDIFEFMKRLGSVLKRLKRDFSANACLMLASGSSFWARLLIC